MLSCLVSGRQKSKHFRRDLTIIIKGSANVVFKYGGTVKHWQESQASMI